MKFGAAAMLFALLCAGLLAAYVLLGGGPEAAKPKPAVKASYSEPLVRSDPGVDPRKEPTVDPRVADAEEPVPEPPPESEQEQDPTPVSPPDSDLGPEPKATEPSPEQPASESEPETLPASEADWPAPTDGQVEKARGIRRYGPLDGAALGLTVKAIGLYDVPVLRSNTQGALDSGVIHARGTSMPWSPTPERNVYLAGHRLGWPGTGSHLVFYRLDELGEGDEVVLEGRDERYVYRVTESLVVGPDDTWVMGRVVGKDMLTLQTCTPIPGFDKRLIVRAERV
ncbi:MAG: sortase [Rubrobacter sp.]